MNDKTRNQVHDIMYEVAKYMNKPSRDLFIDHMSLMSLAAAGNPQMISIEVNNDMTDYGIGFNPFAQFMIDFDGRDFTIKTRPLEETYDSVNE